MNYEEIGKEAAKAGYDGGGIWDVKAALPGTARRWRNLKDDNEYIYLWPDFSYPETEGAALAWIAEKARFECAVYHVARNEFQILGIRPGRNDEPWLTLSGSFSTRVECILHAIKSLNLGKKDNSLMGLNKRLLEVGFRLGRCQWYKDGCGLNVNCDHMSDCDIEKKWLPAGSHPSTIGVATAWLRSFPKIGDSFYVYYNPHRMCWKYCYHHTDPDPIFDSELEALVEFAEWAREEGWMS